MFQRDMVHSPIPALDSKHQSIVTKMDTVIANTFQSIRRLHAMIKTHRAGDELSAEALVKLLRASWAVENSQDSGRQFIVNRDKQSYRTFINTMKRITSHVEALTKKCNQHTMIPFDLTAEALLFGGDIMALTQNYRI
jgi:hypothetical protein